jgi:hypothetical protein
MRSKSASKIRIPLLLLALGGLTITIGCVSRAYQKSDATAASLQDASREVQMENRALEVTLNSLNDLANKPPADLKLQYEGFSNNLHHLANSARKNETMLGRVATKSAAYFASWDKAIQAMSYDAVRNRSQARKEDVRANFDSVYGRYQETQTAVGPLLNYFADIHKALGADLTPEGLAAMKPSISNVNTNAAKLQGALSKLSDELGAFGDRMSSAVIQNRQEGDVKHE